VSDAAEAAKNPAYASLGAVERGTAVPLSDTKVIAGLSQTSVLATPWVIDQITPQLTEATKRTV